MKKHILLIVLLFPALSFAQNFEPYARKVARDWNITGSALAVIKNDSVVFAGGFGEKRNGSGLTVDGNTVFQIGSVSKSFTATLMAMMVDEGLVNWNDPVKWYLPDFSMYDPWVTDNMQVRDLFLHRSGLPEQAGTYIPCLGYDRNDVYRMLKDIPPANSFRTTYGYNNVLFIVAEKIIEAVTGKSWEQNLQERIFTPLGMHNTSVNEAGFLASADGNTPHETVVRNGKIHTSPMEGEEQALHWLTVIGPAGGINSTVTDMMQWCRLHLSDGVVDGDTLLSAAQLAYLHRGQLITSQTDSKTNIYAPCWFVEQNSRYRVWFHTGTTWGFTAICAFVPELQLGLMWLSNCEPPSDPRYAIMRHVIDHYLELPAKDYSAEALEQFLANALEREKKEQQELAGRIAEPSAPYAEYTGIYDHPSMGEAVITLENGALYIALGPEDFPGRKHLMTHVNGETFRFRSGGAAFSLKFMMEDHLLTFDLDLKQNENMGLWRARK
ncbi:MAG: serine hydrolase [Bacteroidales bacterium]|jgi:CubicO group peptidase (beta-lactamase class C family)|nr:serine hydrolase [Bacteroidales bacterium]MDD3100846.1 serine hydrolase [Bacteroidales bacterium]MDD3639488.1 serine hydrolase [Bacteroidales bacterium]MDD3943743.1 serine hydrolase [Bacteroidales bacterium]MDD5314011.1 serine hydrolase [Bacteroidales bacterium]